LDTADDRQTSRLAKEKPRRLDIGGSRGSMSSAANLDCRNNEGVQRLVLSSRSDLYGGFLALHAIGLRGKSYWSSSWRAHFATAAATGSSPLFVKLRDFIRWGRLIEGDIRDATAVDAVFSAYQIDAVMHFAALAYIGESVAVPGRYYDVNVHGTRILLDAMVRARVRLIVFSSSCAVYGEPDDIPIVESTRLDPINPYGFTKVVCERMMDDFDRAYGLRSARLRYFNAAGAEPTAEIGEDHNPETHLVPLILRVASGKSSSLAVFGTDYSTPDGTALRDYVHVCDLARAHVLALEHLLDHDETIAVNLGTGLGVSVRRMIEVARNVTGRPVAVHDAPRRSGDPSVLVADPTKAGELLGWRPQRSDPETIVSDAWRWYQKRCICGVDV
jgi:UDP-glucose 4-epimerase